MRHRAPLLLMLLAPVAEATAPGEWELVGELPDGTVLAVHPKGRLVRIDPATGELRDAPGDGVTTWVEVELDPTRTRFAGIDGDGRVAVCDLADGEFQVGDALTGFLQLHRIRWTSDGRHFVTWSESRTSSDDGLASRGGPPVRLWTRAGKLVWEGPPASDADVRPGHDELCISAVDDEGVRLLVGWPEAAGGAGLVDAGLAGHAHSAAYAPDGARIAATGGKPGTYDSGQPRFTPHLWILDAETGALGVDLAAR